MSRFPFADSGDARAGEPAPPAWMTEALRAPAAERIDARTRIMARVQALPVPHRLVAPMPMARWRRRGTLSGLGGVVLTAALALMLTVREGERFSSPHVCTRPRSCSAILPCRSPMTPMTHPRDETDQATAESVTVCSTRCGWWSWWCVAWDCRTSSGAGPAMRMAMSVPLPSPGFLPRNGARVRWYRVMRWT